MPENPNKFYLTTPIYYVNARPHIGHAYTTIAADVIARRHRLLGDDTFFLTGTDEHGQKVQRSAEAAGIPPQQFADEVSASFQNLWKRMGITNDDYIRTTEPRHHRGVQQLWRTLEARGAIYLSSYTGAYCVSDEAFVDLPAGTPCPDCGRPLETVTEENYFFRLSDYQLPLIDLIESGALHIQPETARNEVLSFLRGGLKDLSISRTTFDWGIKVPGNDKHVVYVWLDALANYITAIGYGSDSPAEQAKFARFWPADLHLVGKEITRFHCVYWPAILLAAGLPLPKSIVANGWLLFEDSKMSKSRGNVVRTETILDAFGEQVYAKQFPDSTKAERDLFAADVLRYFLLREIPFGQDGTFSFDALMERYNSALTNGYGNLVSRTLAMIVKYFDGVVPEISYEAREKVSFLGSLQAKFGFKDDFLAPLYRDLDEYRFDRYLQGIEVFVSVVDETISSLAPWKERETIEKTTENRTFALYYSTEMIRIVTALLYPILPTSTARVWKQLGLGDILQASANGKLNISEWSALEPNTKIGPFSQIFPRADKGLAQIMTDMESPTTPAPEPTPALPTEKSVASVASVLSSPPAATTEAPATAPTNNQQPATNNSPQITIDDFAKVDLRVAQIVVAERIPKADKLLRLEVDLGPNYPRRQILAGIAEYYQPEALIGRKVVIVANLAPRKMRGLESQGMVVAASIGPAGAPVLAGFLEDVELGARLK
jgi:methionyl-tRNA synthetase